MPGASRDEVKRAYRRLAKKFHPDVASEPEDVIKFRQIKHAYEVLTGKNTHSRINYRTQKSSYSPNSKPFESPKSTDAFRRKYGFSKEEWLKRKAASERIRQKNSEESYKAIKTGLLWAVLFTLCVNILYPLSRRYFIDYMVYQNTDSTVATITYVVGSDVGFVFQTPEGLRRTEMRCSYFNSTSYLPNGFPAYKHDTYLLLYNRNYPKYFKIDFNNLHETTKLAYKNRCIEKILENPGPFDNMPKENIPLFIQKVYDIFGLEGLKIIYHHSTSLFKNIRYNSFVYLFFKRNKKYKEIEEKYIT